MGRDVGLARTLAGRNGCFDSSNLYKSHEVASRLANAQACNAELEGLETLIQLGQVPLKEAVGLYQQYINRIPFI
jgi:hypothetical protein